MGSKDKKRYFDFFPRLVGNSPKKAIIVIVVFSIIMGLFAIEVDMDTQQEAFQPDIPKQDYMQEVNEKFGGEEEIVQIAFTAEGGDIFEVETLKDIQEVEERLLEDEAVNRTLAETNEVSSGVMTIRKAIMNADQSLKLEDFIKQQRDETEEGLKAAENQTKMFEGMNISLTSNLYMNERFKGHLFSLNRAEYEKYLEDGIIDPELKGAFEEEGHDVGEDAELFEEEEDWFICESDKKKYRIEIEEKDLNVYVIDRSVEGMFGTRKALLSMSDIVSEPRSWMVIDRYEEEFGNLLRTLDPESGISDERVSSFLDEWLNDMKEEDDPYLESFLNFTEGTKSMLDADLPEGSNLEQRRNMTRVMALSFFSMAEPSAYLAGFDFEDLGEDPPSLELSFEEEKERLSDMTDQEVRRTVLDLIDYDPTELHASVDEGVDNFERMIDESEKSYEDLIYMERILDIAIEETKEMGMEEDAEQLRSGYLAAVKENQTTVNESRSVYLESKHMMEDSRRLGSLLDQMSEMIYDMVSEDFSPDEDLESINAKIGLGMVFMDSSLDNEARLEAQERIIEIGDDIFEDTEISVRVVANQVMMEEINESANRNINRLLPIAFLMVVIILLIVFRSFLETILSLGSLALAIVWTFGFGVMLGYQFDPMVVAVPILITGLVIDYGIHMVLRYREEREGRYKPKGATIVAINTVGGALFLTTFTTAVGFLSNTLSNIQSMRQFGILAAIGIISSFLLMTVFLPAVIQTFDEKKEKKKKSRSKRNVADKTKQHGKDIISGMLSTSADAADSHPFLVLLVVGIISFSSIYGVVNIDSTFSMDEFLPEDQPQSKNMDYLSANFDVTTDQAYILTEGDIETSEYLYALNETAANIATSDMVGGDGGDVESPLTIMRDYGTAPPGSPDYNSSIVQKFAESDNTGDQIPDENITEIYDMLFEFERSRDAMEGVLNRTSESTYTSGVIRLLEAEEKITEDLSNAAILEDDLEEAVEPLESEDFTAKITSNTMISEESNSELMDTQSRSLILTIFIVALTLSIVFYTLHKSVVLGIITTIPVALITLWIIATMYVVGVSLNVMTASITALTVGMGVDYSIHITHRFMEETENNNLLDAMHETVKNTGAALFGSATTTIAAFAILSTSDMMPLSQFGSITALALLYSFIVAVFVLPSGLMIWAKYKEDPKG